MRLSPTLARLNVYPFTRLTEAKRRLAAEGVEVLDFGVGEPREETPSFIRAALAEAVEAEPVSTYPLAEGLPELRAAIAAWLERRFATRLDPDAEIVPTLGTKEAIFSLAQVVDGAVGVPTPGYPVPGRGALFAGREVVEVPLDAANGWLPDLDALPWDRLGLLWLNTPGNPTGVAAPAAFLEEAAERCRAHDVVLACDEAYSELWFEGAPPASGLQTGRTNVIAFNTLSKRSSMPGYRSGFAAGDPELIAALKRYRPNVGTAPQTFVQRASIAAWGDEEHVVETRERYARKRAILLPALLEAGLELAGGHASFFLWMRAPEGWAEEALRRGIVVTPGEYLGPGGDGHVRIALVPTVEECERAARLLSDWRGASR
ncbi:MAG TPA: aminotransferase class I/II-fold pyridoxal phosphate-dependent enzyme [Solirubrobacteraceae bacterium]|nr:aminotransferase class I/II-fold pyridoxal phosphate-dependent enzyme [Solirubrobacteraceae bacterium]